ncbi:Hsp33 family molecular chaperone [Methylocystis heyeri]|uniref:Hsp33 family molecular chaperone n=1 Tax=Methylocystis heyeri TaxID=391905 RepID=A0A6B8KKA5_9HYPH|nr:Hsp33 family molecular chaperone [Methylocystis heyeri]QGM47033.1 Hsp33 family molecular chaperone [Methylocystis heyeri]
MSDPNGDTPSRPFTITAQDDRLLPFAVEGLDLRGRLVRFGPTVDAILSHYDYPLAVARALGESIALTALLGSVLESHGRFQMQTRSDGPVDMIVVDYDAPGQLRGFARFDAERVGQARSTGELLGLGNMAFTIEREEDAARYQGVVALEGESLEEAAHRYFSQSEQIPTFVRLAVAEAITPQGRSWRAGGLLLQHLPSGGSRPRDLHPGDAPEGMASSLADEERADAWAEGLALAATIQDHELVDPNLSGERLLYRLFHERGVKVFPEREMAEFCRCSDLKVENLIRSFPPHEREHMVGDDGRIGVTCEFCGVSRSYDPKEFE